MCQPAAVVRQSAGCYQVSERRGVGHWEWARKSWGGRGGGGGLKGAVRKGRGLLKWSGKLVVLSSEHKPAKMFCFVLNTPTVTPTIQVLWPADVSRERCEDDRHGLAG